MDAIHPATLLFFVSSCVSLAALLDALFWYMVWREKYRWEHIGADGKRYCAGKIKRRLLAGAMVACVALYAIDQGAQIP